MKNICHAVVGLGGLLALSGAVHADFIPGASLVDPELPGTTASDIWPSASLSKASNPGLGDFPGFEPWPSGIASASGSTGHDAQLIRISGGVSGGPFPSGGSIYFGSFTLTANALGGALAVQDATPLPSLATVVLQLEIGEVLGYDFWDSGDADDVGELPLLQYNGGSAERAPARVLLTQRVEDGVAPVGEDPVYINTYLLQWDLRDIADIEDISISFSAVQHSQVYALRLDQSDTYAPVPEPAAMGLVGAAGLLMMRRRRR